MKGEKMNDHDRKVLSILLTELIAAQDAVTHENERGPDFERSTRNMIKIREGVRRRIEQFFEAVTRDVAQ
jgi:hypothetical protein